MSREDNISIFKDTINLCNSKSSLKDAIINSKSRQSVILESDSVNIKTNVYNRGSNIIVSKKRSLEAASQYKDSKVCVLNFASATNAGGGVVNGSSAQEECLCRCSTLYPCISDNEIVSKFHNVHKSMLKSGKIDATYNDDCIYTPDVVVFKSDTNSPKLLPESDWYKIDVISCAAPNLREKPSNSMNPNSGSKQVVLKPSELLNIHIKRLTRIFDIAESNGVEVLILGAFGCGAFQNSPEIVAEAFSRVLKTYKNAFDVVEFAVYCTPKDTKNFDVFNRRFRSK